MISKRFHIFLVLILLLSCFENKSVETAAAYEEEQPGLINTDLLKNEIVKILNDEYSNYAVYIYDLKNKIEIGINQTDIFYPASICKIPYAILILKDIDSGVLSFDDTIRLENSTVAYSFDYMANLPLNKDYEIEFYLSNLIQKSDNTAMMIIEKFLGGTDTVNERFKTELGITNFFRDPHTATALEIGKILKAIYYRTILSDSSSEYLLNLMRNPLPEYQDRIPAGLPEGIEAAHKIGQLSFPEGLVYEDAGIVFGDKTDYILVLLNKEVNKTEAVDKITRISSVVYGFFNQQ